MKNSLNKIIKVLHPVAFILIRSEVTFTNISLNLYHLTVLLLVFLLPCIKMVRVRRSCSPRFGLQLQSRTKLWNHY